TVDTAAAARASAAAGAAAARAAQPPTPVTFMFTLAPPVAPFPPNAPTAGRWRAAVRRSQASAARIDSNPSAGSPHFPRSSAAPPYRQVTNGAADTARSSSGCGATPSTTVTATLTPTATMVGTPGVTTAGVVPVGSAKNIRTMTRM